MDTIVFPLAITCSKVRSNEISQGLDLYHSMSLMSATDYTIYAIRVGREKQKSFDGIYNTKFRKSGEATSPLLLLSQLLLINWMIYVESSFQYLLKLSITLFSWLPGQGQVKCVGMNNLYHTT